MFYVASDDFSTASGTAGRSALQRAGSPTGHCNQAGGANLPPPFPPYTAADAWEDAAARAPVLLMAVGAVGAVGLVIWVGAWAGGLVR